MSTEGGYHYANAANTSYLNYYSIIELPQGLSFISIGVVYSIITTLTTVIAAVNSTVYSYDPTDIHSAINATTTTATTYNTTSVQSKEPDA